MSFDSFFMMNKVMFTDIRRGCINVSQRYIFSLMCFFALFNAFAMRGCLSIAITEMAMSTNNDEGLVEEETCSYSDDIVPDNSTSSTGSTKGTYDWDEFTQGLILSSFYWGYVVTHLPGGWVAEKYGGKHTLGFGILLTAVFTLLTPAAIYVGDSTALIILRIFMGLGEGTTYPAINVLLAKWTPPEERSRTASFVYAGALIGTVYATTVSGWILQYSSIGWPLVFYVMGTISVIWFFIWLPACYNSPKDHPFISEKEVNYLNERMNEHTHEKPPPVPWRHILSSKPLWAVIIALIGFNWSILSIITDLPKYLSGVLKFSVANNGYLTSLVYLCMWIGGNTSPWLADYLISKKNVSTTKVRKYGSIVALAISSSFIVAASYAGCDRVLVIGMFTVAMTMMGAAYPSVMVNPLDLSPNYAGTLMALTNGLSALTGIAGPYLIGIMTPNQTLGEWRFVFWILFGVSIVSNAIFLVFGSGDVEYWNDPEFVRNEISEKERKRSNAA
ncbi:sialin-like [Nasonia vitripennis]|uniref:Sialin n=1 Tax=Nasonia vitripennis TaxID=7425 RepID=A0A7M7G3B4_NASVI|nr:sialin-like [Nasonia vitripennis]XP_031776989.1 sialin-like [Nasonia vitripennis]